MHPRTCYLARSLFPVAILACLCSCATGPSPASLRIAPDFNERIATVSNVVILVDFCVTRASISKRDYYCLEESRRAELLAAYATQDLLQDKQYPGRAILTPFIGAFLAGPTDTYDVAEKSGDPIQNLPAPFRTEANVQTNEEFKQGLLQTMACASYTFGPKGATNSPPAGMDQISRELLPFVTKNTGANAALVVVGRGRIVTGGKQFTEGLTTGLLTTAMTLGFATIAVADVPYIETWAALVDLRDGKILWFNSTFLKDFNPTSNSYLGLWTYPEFHDLPAMPNPSPPPTPLPPSSPP